MGAGNVGVERDDAAHVVLLNVILNGPLLASGRALGSVRVEPRAPQDGGPSEGGARFGSQRPQSSSRTDVCPGSVTPGHAACHGACLLSSRHRQRVLGACSLPLARPDVVPEVEVPGGLDAREDARHGLFLVVMRVATLSLVPY